LYDAARVQQLSTSVRKPAGIATTAIALLERVARATASTSTPVTPAAAAAITIPVTTTATAPATTPATAPATAPITTPATAPATAPSTSTTPTLSFSFGSLVKGHHKPQKKKARGCRWHGSIRTN